VSAPVGQRRAALPVARPSKESFDTGLLRQKAPSSRPRKTVRVDARRRIGSRRSESDSFDCHLPSQGVRGSPARAVRQPIKLRQLPRGHAKARSRLPGDQSRLRAVKRATVGGWMTARWSGVFHECSAETPRSQDPQLGRRRVFPRAIDQVSKSGASAGARNANVGCRNEFEASWRCVQVEPRGETSSSAERR